MNYETVKTAMIKAIAREENWAGSEINWNFVDADAYMDCVDDVNDSGEFYSLFNRIADELEATGELFEVAA